jgi:hypothetical protein
MRSFSLEVGFESGPFEVGTVVTLPPIDAQSNELDNEEEMI